MTTRILRGDVRAMLATLPDESVHCVVTSPPYFGLRSYLPDGHADKALEMGSEPTLADYLAGMVAVFREVRRVLRADGSVWCNIGDSYASAGGSGDQGSRGARFGRRHTQEALPNTRAQAGGTHKPKDLMMVPARFAIALQDDGWFLRSDIIWHKPSCMPESCTDRPTSAHEHIFLLTKSSRYFYDAEAIAEPTSASTHARLSQDTQNQVGSARANGGAKTNGPMKAVGRKLAADGSGTKNNGSFDAAMAIMPAMRNSRNVWSINSAAFSEAHFATFPPELPERCIKAGTSEHGCCPSCGAPWRRIVTKGAPDLDAQRAAGGDANGAYAGQSTKGHDGAGVQNASDVKRRILEGMRERSTTGWQPTCSCDVFPLVPAVVLDPFGGAGTTALVADRLGRDAILIELNPEYAAMADRRIRGDAGLFANVETV